MKELFIKYLQEIQFLASNIDIAFICTALNENFSLRRIERYLSMVWDSGATPIIVLTKMDTCEDYEIKMEQVRNIAIGVSIVMTTKDDLTSVQALFKYIDKNMTAVFLGSSGVGKSTLINLLLGKELMDTSYIRQDGRGRHTTTHRQLILLDNGGILIDTPGLREIQIDVEDISRTYFDISSLSANCRFKDYTHTSEPGCAVLEAIENGEITEDRLTELLV